MRAIRSTLIAVGGALILAGCAAQTPQTRLTRFHLDQPIAPGEVVVEPRDPTLAKDLEFQSYASIVQGELTRLGFGTARDLTKSELVAVTDVRRYSQPVGQARSPLSIGLGGGSFGGGVGVGGGVSFPVGKPRQNYEDITELSVQLKRRSEGTVIWEGRAQTGARSGTAAAAPEAQVRTLATALFRDFPGKSGETITVK